MGYREIYEQWLNNDYFDAETHNELRALNDEKEIEDRFYRDLSFGTGGMRGIMGAGTNRLNKYTVGRATKGLGRFLHDKFGFAQSSEKGVVIAYDTRNNSKDLAEAAADILTGMGIRVYMFDKPVPTPELSFAIRKLMCISGIVITASHNPKEYNGYKVYDEHGGQLVPGQAKQVIKYINEIADYTSVSFDGNKELKQYIDLTESFVNAVIAESISAKQTAKDLLGIVYTPLHGTGNIPVRTALEKAGFGHVYIVKEQENPDGDFSTVESPNPEVKSSMDMGLRLGKETNADIVLGTDPDCDRVGIGVRTASGEYQLLTGNQLGALLSDYVIGHTALSEIKNPAIVKTVVTSDLGAEIAKKNGIAVFSTLTGFKFIGEKITQFEKAKTDGDTARAYSFLLGYEESYGYLTGTYARDKDSVGACLLICEMAAEYKKSGFTLLDRLERLYSEYGYYLDAQDSFTLKGKDGLERISAMMAELRSGEAPFEGTARVIDYIKPVKAEEGFGELPTSNVLKFIMADGSWIAVRPSGTEPKIKIYYSIKASDKTAAEQKLDLCRNSVKKRLNIEN